MACCIGHAFTLSKKPGSAKPALAARGRASSGFAPVSGSLLRKTEFCRIRPEISTAHRHALWEFGSPETYFYHQKSRLRALCVLHDPSGERRDWLVGTAGFELRNGQSWLESISIEGMRFKPQSPAASKNDRLLLGPRAVPREGSTERSRECGVEKGVERPRWLSRS
jgi:hypothetical protein